MAAKLTVEQVKAIEDIINSPRHSSAEVKIECGKPVVVELVRRKKA